MLYFVGAGSGAVDLITVRGQRLLQQADVVIYAGSLVNPQLLRETKPDCRIYNSAKMTLEEVLEVIQQATKENADIVRLHTGDPCLYGAIREQMDWLEQQKIPYEYSSGVSLLLRSAAALRAEYTLPDSLKQHYYPYGRKNTRFRKKEEISNWQLITTMRFQRSLSKAGMLADGRYDKDTGGDYKASWPEEKTFRCTVSTLAQTAKENQITKTALILVGNFLGNEYELF